MRRRLTQLCIPLLAILVMAWGTCPCLYAEVLSGGSVCFDATPAGTCNCEGAAADSDAQSGLTANGGEGTNPDRCPCGESIGTMHELPQAEESVLYAGDATVLVHETLIPRPVAFATEDRGLPTGADPGPALQSVVLLV